MLSIIRRKLGINHIELPKSIREWFVRFKYVFLALILLLSIIIALPGLANTRFREEFFLPFCQVCPARVLFPLFGGVTPCWYNFGSIISTTFTFLGWIFLLFFLMSFFVRRLWCMVCPLGVIISFFNRGALITKEKDIQRCTKCGTCALGCTMGSTYVYEEKRNKKVTHTECIFCLRCIELCPESECLKLKVFNKTLFKSK